MANRTGVYIAFDGLGQADPSKSDFRFYATIQCWDASKNIDFKFINSHEKTAAVRDNSKRATLEARIRERLSVSKNIVIILSSKTRKSGSMLSYEIEKAVDTYKIPLIIAYTDYDVVARVNPLKSFWPDALDLRLDRFDTQAIHVPFLKIPLFDAISQFSVNTGQKLSSGKQIYTQETYENWGLIRKGASVFENVRKSETDTTA